MPLLHYYNQLTKLQADKAPELSSFQVAKAAPDRIISDDYNLIETTIAEVIADKLQLEEVGIHSHFFDELGGTSLGLIVFLYW